MDIQQLSVKLFTEDAPADAQEALIPVLHRWIRDGLIADHLLIDVADYRHVPNGPGVMLIAHEAHIALDEGRGGVGLSYSAKRDPVGPAADKLGQGLGVLLAAAELVEAEGIGIKFATDRLNISVLSRLTTGNTADDGAALVEAISGPLTSLLGAGVEIVRDDRDGPLTLTVSAPESRGLNNLRASLGVTGPKKRRSLQVQ